VCSVTMVEVAAVAAAVAAAAVAAAADFCCRDLIAAAAAAFLGVIIFGAGDSAAFITEDPAAFVKSCFLIGMGSA